MAKNVAAADAEQDDLADFETMAKGLINEAIRYASDNVFDEKSASNIRRVRILCNMLLAAAAQADQVSPTG